MITGKRTTPFCAITPSLATCGFCLNLSGPKLASSLLRVTRRQRRFHVCNALWSTSAPKASQATSLLATHDFRIWSGGSLDAPGSSPSVSSQPCAQPYNTSVINILALSRGSLSANAIYALNSSAHMGGFAHDTGEGPISTHHRKHGGGLSWRLARLFWLSQHDGTFNAEYFGANARDPQVKLSGIKLNQGAKPGHGGILPGSRVTAQSWNTTR